MIMRGINGAVILAFVLAANAQNEVDSGNKRLVLPVEKLGDASRNIKGIGGFSIQSRPGKGDSVERLVCPDAESLQTFITPSRGTNASSTLVKSNKYTAITLLDDKLALKSAGSELTPNEGSPTTSRLRRLQEVKGHGNRQTEKDAGLAR